VPLGQNCSTVNCMYGLMFSDNHCFSLVWADPYESNVPTVVWSAVVVLQCVPSVANESNIVREIQIRQLSWAQLNTTVLSVSCLPHYEVNYDAEQERRWNKPCRTPVSMSNISVALLVVFTQHLVFRYSARNTLMHFSGIPFNFKIIHYDLRCMLSKALLKST